MKQWILILMLFAAGFSAAAQAPPVVLTIGTASNVVGSVSIPVTVQNFQQILACQGTIQWDNTKLVLDSVSGAAAQLAGIQFNTSVQANMGFVSYIWVDNAVVGQSLPANTVLFRLNFTATATAGGQVPVQFVNVPTQQLIVNASGATVTAVQYNNGWLQLAAAPQVPRVAITSVNAGNQALVTIPITASFFYNIIGFQGSITWDSTLFTFSNIQNIHPSLVGFQFNSTSSSATNPPAVSFLWLNDALQAQSFAANTVLFSLVLQVKGIYPQTTEVSFANWPTVTQLIAADGSLVTNVQVTNGTIGIAGSQAPPAITVGSKLFCTDTAFTVAVSARNFRNLTAMQGTINWDVTKIRIANITNIAPALAGINFDSSVANSTGKLAYLWADGSVTPQTISENATLFTIRFRVVPGATGYTPISFGNAPTPLVLASAQGTAIANASYTDGLVTFTNTICIDGAVSITSNIFGNNYQWQIDSGQGFQNLANAGIYSGVSSATLSLSSVPVAMGGYKLRCKVGVETSEVFPIQFTNFWLGGNSTAWQNASNWSCNVVPDRHTNVVISSAIQNPIIQSNVVIRSLQVATGLTVRVAAGFTLELTGNE